MKRILVAYDASEGSVSALREMTRGGFPERAEARVLTIAEVWLPPEPAGESSGDRSLAAASQDAKTALREAKSLAVQGAQLLHTIFPDWNITNTARADSPAWGILAEAREWQADLIVVGSHGRTPLEGFFLGSVSYKVAAEANCSVRIMRALPHRVHQPTCLLVGIDGSEEAMQAVDEILERRWSDRTKIHLVVVIDPKLRRHSLEKAARSGTESDRTENWIESLLQCVRAKFAARGLQVESHILQGDPKHLILSDAKTWEADCICLGARGLDHGHRLYLGTLASAICTRAHCSVEITRNRTWQSSAQR